jgi:hypothetical protein
MVTTLRDIIPGIMAIGGAGIMDGMAAITGVMAGRARMRVTVGTGVMVEGRRVIGSIAGAGARGAAVSAAEVAGDEVVAAAADGKRKKDRGIGEGAMR